MTAVFDPTLPEQQENPFEVLELARREQPVFFAEKFDLWVVTRYDDVLAVLKDHRSFSSTGALKSSPAPVPARGAGGARRGVARDAVHHRGRSAAARPHPRAGHEGVHAAADRCARARHRGDRRRVARRVRGRRARSTSIGASPGRCRCACSVSCSACRARILRSCIAGGNDWLLVQQEVPARAADRARPRRCRSCSGTSSMLVERREDAADRRPDRRARRRPQRASTRR